MKDSRTPEQVAAANAATFMEIGPKLSTRYSYFVEARDRANGMVLLGGLGSCGVGTMWFRDKEEFANAAGYDDAPECKCPTDELPQAHKGDQ